MARRSNYVKAAAAAALELAAARGRPASCVAEAVEAGTLSDQEWCALLDRARYDHDIDGRRHWDAQCERLLELVRTHPGYGTRRLADMLGKKTAGTTQMLADLCARGRIYSEGYHYKRYYARENKHE